MHADGILLQSLQDGDYFHFETKGKFPLFEMDIGENYVDGYIMGKGKGEQGRGCKLALNHLHLNVSPKCRKPLPIASTQGMYLEYHDEPHYHEPMDELAGGCYILAREVGRALPGPARRNAEVTPQSPGLSNFHITAFKVLGHMA